jgi:hypothetical protein
MSITPLHERTFRARVGFAYIVDALYNLDGDVRPGNTTERLYHNVTCESQHAYSRIWQKIEKIYDDFWFDDTLASELSESELLRAVNAALTIGAKHEGSTASGADVVAKAAAWSKRGWFRYEEKKQEKINKAKKWGMVGALVISGFIL